jgi:hypothetical protein
MRNSVPLPLGKISVAAFSVIESLVVITVILVLFFVLAPAAAYQMGWLRPPRRDLDVHIRDVRHPTASRIPTTNQAKQGQAPVQSKSQIDREKP